MTDIESINNPVILGKIFPHSLDIIEFRDNSILSPDISSDKIQTPINYNTPQFEKEVDCPVCFEDMIDVDDCLSCGHWVHRSCVLKWSNKCPICRQKIKLTKQEKTEYKNRQDNNPPDQQNESPVSFFVNGGTITGAVLFQILDNVSELIQILDT